MFYTYIVSLTLLITAIIYMGIGFLINTSIKGSKSRKSYLLACISLTIWSLMFGMMTIAHSEYAARIFWSIGIIMSSIFFPSWVLFLSYFTLADMQKIRRFIYVLFCSTITFTLFYIFSGSVKIYETGFGYMYGYESCILFYLLFGHMFISLICMVVLLVKWILESNLKRHRKLAVTFGVWIAVFAPPMVFIDFIAPVLGSFILPPLGTLLILIVSVKFYQILRDYRSLDVTLQNIAQDMFTSLNLPVLVLNQNNTIILANKYSTNFLSNDLIGRKITEIIKIDNETPDENLFDQGLNDVIINLTGNDGSKTCYMVLTVIKDYYEETLCKILTIFDITELLEAKDEAEERFSLMFDRTPLAITIWNKNLELIDCNKESYQLMGFDTKEDFINNYDKGFPEFQPDGSPSLELFFQECKKALEEGFNWIEWTVISYTGITIPLDLTMARISKGDDDYELMMYARDLTEHNALLSELRKIEIAEESDRIKNDFIKKLNTLNELSNKMFLSEIDTFDSEIWEAMKILGASVNADRMYIWKNFVKNDLLHCKQIYEWHEAVESIEELDIAKEICYSEVIPEWETNFLQGISINDYVRHLSDNEREILEPQGIKSILVAPIYVNDYFWGFAGFDDCKQERIFNSNEENLLNSASMLLINAINRNEMAKKVRVATKQLEEALGKAEHATKAKSKFLASMSHEIRTPMNAIIGISQMMLQKNNLPEEIAIALEKIFNSGSSLLGIINDILDLSKIETGKMDINPIEYHLPSLINDTVQLNMVRIGSKSINIILDIDEALPRKLIGDELRIKQILSNLISNAIKYTDRGHVKLTVKIASDPLKIENNYLTAGLKIPVQFIVEDTGQGMKDTDNDRLFTAYSRFNVENNKMIEGTGIGLNITKNLIDLMDGTIEVKSEFGIGSTFTVTILQKTVESEAIGSELVSKLCSFTYNGNKQYNNIQIITDTMPYGKILLVDDVETNLYVAEGLLSPYELQIDKALSGFESIENIKSGKTYDIIFMDHMMPIMDGIETTQQLRIMGYKGTIVALTANAIIGNENLFLENGFDDFISKPIDVRILDNLLTKYIRNKYNKEKDIQVSVTKTHSATLSPKLIELFIQDAEKSIVTIRKSLSTKHNIIDENDLKLFTINAHALKATLASINEPDKSNKAAELEKAGHENDLKFIFDNTDDFIESIELLIKNLKKSEIMIDDVVGIQEDREFLVNQLQNALSACEEYNDSEAYIALDQLQSKEWNTQTLDAIADIRETLYLFSDFDSAVEKIKVLIDK